jgi:NADPH-dependent curcumin reductase CurA
MATRGTINRQWRLAARPVGLIKESDFAFREEPIPDPKEGQVLVRNLYLSLDPTMRGWVRDLPSYLPPVAIGEVMRGGAIGVVEKSRNELFPEGAYVSGMLGWQDYGVSDGSWLQVLTKNPAIPLTAYFGLFGMVGLTAYFGLLEIGRPQPGETLVITAAAGAVGSLVGQIGKIKGCRVVGIAGSDQKCTWISDELGFDAAINYKREPVLERLKDLCSSGIDIHYENVGGAVLDAALALINLRARIVLCGMISMYNNTEPSPGPYLLGNLIVKRARMEGFIVLDYFDRAQEAMADLMKWYTDGRLRYRVDVIEGLEQAPRAINKLFDGTNRGKLIVKV